jgi:hypothetical protein
MSKITNTNRIKGGRLIWLVKSKVF